LLAIVAWAMPTFVVTFALVVVVNESSLLPSRITTSPAITPPPDLFVSVATTAVGALSAEIEPPSPAVV
jgi:uncharacterized membrane protein YadS